MSWFVSQLLFNSEIIKEKVLSLAGKVDLEGEPYLIPDTDSYDDLLSVEITIEKLRKNRLISELDELALDTLVNQIPILTVCADYSITRATIAGAISSLCQKIAIILGDKFTDAGYRDYLARKYNLTEEELLAVDTYIAGNYSYKNTYKKRKK
jgi:hypothetical protein